MRDWDWLVSWYVDQLQNQIPSVMSWLTDGRVVVVQPMSCWKVATPSKGSTAYQARSQPVWKGPRHSHTPCCLPESIPMTPIPESDTVRVAMLVRMPPGGGSSSEESRGVEGREERLPDMEIGVLDARACLETS